MKAYSHDLRERAVAACAEPGAKTYQVAARFSVSLSFTDKLLRRQRTSGSVAELPRHPGSAPRLNAAGDQRLLACLRPQPDATLAEIGQALAAAGGSSLQRTAVWQAVERLGGGRKKSVHAAERDTERVVSLRQPFVEAIQEEGFTCFVFVDETSTNLTYCRRYGRAPAGQRLDQAVPLHGGPNETLKIGLTIAVIMYSNVETALQRFPGRCTGCLERAGGFFAARPLVVRPATGWAAQEPPTRHVHRSGNRSKDALTVHHSSLTTKITSRWPVRRPRAGSAGAVALF